jgi:hypothetical protein
VRITVHPTRGGVGSIRRKLRLRRGPYANVDRTRVELQNDLSRCGLVGRFTGALFVLFARTNLASLGMRIPEFYAQHY